MPSLQHSSWTPLPRVMAMLRGNKRCNGHENLRQGVEAHHRASSSPCTVCCTGQGAASFRPGRPCQLFCLSHTLLKSPPAGPFSCCGGHRPRRRAVRGAEGAG